MTTFDCHDIIIVGGGPVGLFAAYYAGLRDMRVRLIDRRHEFGGQITAIYPEKWVYDIPGIPAIRGKALFKNMVKQIEPYNIPCSLNEEIIAITKNRNQILRLESKSGNVYHSKSVLLCMGMGEHKPRKLNLPNLESFEGKGIHYGVHKLSDFEGKNVLVAGGGDSALDLALTIVEQCKDLTLIHRNDRFNAHEETVKKLYSSNTQIKLFQELTEIQGNADALQGVQLKDLKSGIISKLPVDAIILAIGLLFNLERLADWGLTLEQNSIVVNHNRQTNIPGIYAAGDIVTYPGKMKLIGTGTAESMQAIHHAKHYIQENFPNL